MPKYGMAYFFFLIWISYALISTSALLLHFHGQYLEAQIVSKNVSKSLFLGCVQYCWSLVLQVNQ